MLLNDLVNVILERKALSNSHASPERRSVEGALGPVTTELVEVRLGSLAETWDPRLSATLVAALWTGLLGMAAAEAAFVFPVLAFFFGGSRYSSSLSSSSPPT